MIEDGKKTMSNVQGSRINSRICDPLSSIFHPLDFKLARGIWRKQLFQLDRSVYEPLLAHVANQGLENVAVGFDPVGPPVRSEKRFQLLDLGEEPRERGGVRVGDLEHRANGALLRLGGGLIRSSGNQRVLLVKCLADRSEEHTSELQSQ